MLGLGFPAASPSNFAGERSAASFFGIGHLPLDRSSPPLLRVLRSSALVQGIHIENRAYAGGWFDWLTPFSLLTGAALVVGYALLGATWLVMKTDGYVHDRARIFAWITGIGTVGLIGLVSLLTPYLNPVYLDHWFGWPNVIFSSIVPVLVLGAAYLLFNGLRKEAHTQPFLAALRPVRPLLHTA